MALFRRTPKGRHALGAAVTSIPSGPSAVSAARVAAPPAATLPAAVVPAAPAPGRAPDIASSVAELLASGEAWAQDLEVFHVLHAAPAAVVHQPPVQAAPVLGPAYEVVAAPVPQPVGVQLSAAEVTPAPVLAPRVQLGFRDGTSATLEPGSSQALALEALALTLTSRD